MSAWGLVKVAILCGGADGCAAIESRVRERGFEVATAAEFLHALSMPWRTVFDFETRNEISVVDVGAWKYAAHPSDDVLCVAWSSRPSGTNRPIYVAHNTSFEQAQCLRHIPGFVLDPEQWTCTASRARRLGIPGGLEGACNVMRTAHRKSVEGHRVMLQVSQPRPLFVNKGTGPKWFEDADRLATNAVYCAEDIYAERDLDDVLPELPPFERQVWLQVERGNRRGLCLDVPLIAAMEPLVSGEEDRVLAELRRPVELGGTGIADFSLTAPAAVREFCARRGVHLPDLKKETVEAILSGHRSGARPTDYLVAKVLEGRQTVGKSSNAKLPAMRARLQEDGFARDYAIYHGAHTGRQTGSAVNPLNMPKPYKGYEQAAVVDMIMRQDVAAIEASRVTPSVAVSATLRGAIIAPPGKKLVIGDYATIEPCVLFVLAGQWDAVRILREGGDIYCEMASAVYERQLTKEKNPKERGLGKALVLGCFGPETRVVTHRGVKRIIDVRSDDKLWDGERWNSHGGLLNQGRHSVMNLAGLWVTPEHLILCGSTWVPARYVARVCTLRRALATASENLPYPVISSGLAGACSRFACGVHAVRQSILSILTISSEGLLRGVMRALRKVQERTRSIFGATRTSAPTTPTAVGYYVESALSKLVASIQRARCFVTTEGVAFSSATSFAIDVSSSRTFLHCLGGIKRSLNWIARTTIEVMNGATYALSLVGRTVITAGQLLGSRRKSIVYDIAFAGPKNRYTIVSDAGPLIVHNCGYGMGKDKFVERLKLDGVNVDDALAHRAHSTYRTRFPEVPNLWRGIEEAIKSAIRNPHVRFAYGIITYAFDGYWLVCTLPSGRSLFYPNAQLQPGKYGDEVTYEGRTLGGGWGTVRTWGGSCVENLCQAISRDITMEDKLECEHRYGWHVPLDVYDEIVAECDEDDSAALEKLDAVMSRPRQWLPQIPIRAECFTAHRYRKE